MERYISLVVREHRGKVTISVQTAGAEQFTFGLAEPPHEPAPVPTPDPVPVPKPARRRPARKKPAPVVVKKAPAKKKATRRRR